VVKYRLQRHNWEGVMQNIRYALMNLDPQKDWVIEIKKHVERRTNDQNSKFHAMCGELADVIGYTDGELKRLIKHELGFYTVVNGPVGKVARLESSADWNTEKMSRAIEQLNMWAIEVGHVWRIDHD
jgi:predicted dithiol-disulfide oxidoreductase (DUF899 family)